jgi:Winged helix DNA-binding domain
VRTVDLHERRARLARRHRLAPLYRAHDVVDAATSLVALHGTDPATVYLSARSRVDDMAVEDMERALYVDRSLVKHLAMRRTLWVLPRETLASAQAGASLRVADRERRRLVADVERAGLHRDGAGWLAAAGEQVLTVLSEGGEASWADLRAAIPLLEGAITYGEGKSWGGQAPVGPRVLTVLSGEGRIVRGTNDGAWTAARHRWATTASWLGREIPWETEAEGLADLVERWLRAFGPGTEADLKWWLGTTVKAVRRALADVRAVEVDLGGRTGYLALDDLEPVGPVDPWAALLPPLDPTTMGWYEREWYLGGHRSQVFDSTGNAGPTAWWDGRVVGGWRTGDSGEVVVQLLEDVGSDGRDALEAEVRRLTAWLAGARVPPRFPSPLSKTPVGDVDLRRSDDRS